MHWLPPFGAFLIGLVFAQQPVINAAVARIVGSPIAAAFADHVGAFGLPVRTATPMRLLGLAFVAVGAALVQRG